MAIKNPKLKYLTPVIHVLFWMLLFFLPHIVRISTTGLQFSESVQNRLFLNNLVLIGFFYLNAYILYPSIYKKRGLTIYLVTLIVAVAICMNATSYVERSFFPIKRKVEMTTANQSDPANKEKSSEPRKNWNGKRRGTFFYFSLLPYIFIIGTSISYRIVRDSSREEKIRKEKENETLKTELNFLRSQVSPHFMFNVLNTLVSMARKKSDLMEPSLIQLSSLMRYMLYESNDERIHLDQEVEYLKSYIDLQLLRFGDDLNIQLNIAKDIEGYEIEPMLLISFVENAFKHGIGMVQDPFIKINLSIDKAKHWLEFVVENSVSPLESGKDKSSGIGLNNMRRRLELLYKDSYSLETFQKDSTFVSKLHLRLK